MRWSFQIASITGIQIRLHLTFLFFLGWVGFSDGLQGGWLGAVSGMTLVMLVFSCVLLHELGHAWAARYFGIRTPDITLLPIGGIARLERIPERPGQEIVVAVAGPFVSAGLALGFGMWSDFSLPPLDQNLYQWGYFSSKLFAINTGLLAFNLLPLFPMDGGRVLRALLAFHYPYGRSTRIAARISQSLAIFMGLGGVWLGAPMLIFISIFVFLGAGAESEQVEMRESSQGLSVSDTMLTHFTVLPMNAQLADAADLLLHGAQSAFPLCDESNRFLALLTRESLLSGLNEAGPLGDALAYAAKDLPKLDPSWPLARACLLCEQHNSSVLPVLDSHGTLAGLFATDTLGDLMAMNKKSRSMLFSWFKWRRS